MSRTGISSRLLDGCRGSDQERPRTKRNGTSRPRGDTTSKSIEKIEVVLPLPSWAPFPIESLPEPLRGFVTTAAEAIGCDPSYVGLPSLAALASAIGNTRRIELKRGWTEPAVLWSAIVGESGTLKSPALDAPLKPIRERQAGTLKAHQQLMTQYLAEVETYKAELAEWKSKGRRSGRPQPATPEMPVCERYLCSDITVEALAERLSHASRGLLVVREELAGWLRSFDQYKGGKGGDLAHWLAMHGARELLVDRRTGDKPTIYVRHAAVSITGGIQPMTLRRTLDREHFEDGLAARLLLAMPPRQTRRWTEAEIPHAADAGLAHVFDRLWELRPDGDEHGEPIPINLPLTDESKQVWISFYNTHAQEQAELSGDLSAAFSKLEGYAARLALILHLVRWADDDSTLETPNAIDAQSIEAGIQLSRWFGQEARRVYAVLAESDLDTERRELIELIGRKGGRITVRELMHASRRYREDAELAEQALNELVNVGHGRWLHDDHDGQGGRPVMLFELFQER